MSKGYEFMRPTAYTPQEVAAMSGAPLSVVQKAVTARKIPASVDRRSHRRRLDGAALLAFALIQALPRELSLSPADAYQLVKRLGLSPIEIPGDLIIGDVVRIDARKALAPARRRMQLYERARELIVSDPEIMGGSPTIRGTRITAQAILGRINAGETITSILDDYPYLNQETVEAAAIYAKANAPRGRPAGKLMP
jgi:uncharacterized protein (DUF433 family)